MYLTMSYAKWRPFCFGLNVLSMQSIKSTETNILYLCKLFQIEMQQN